MPTARVFVAGLALFATQSAWAQNLPNGICMADCTGTAPAVTPFSFGAAALQKGDPNGGSLGSTFKAPPSEGAAASESVPSGDFLQQMDNAEKAAASRCGKSLNDDSWNSLQVTRFCAKNIYDRMALQWKGAHKPGIAPPSVAVMDSFFEAARSSDAQKALQEQTYQKRGNTDKPYCEAPLSLPPLGNTELLAVSLSTNLCRQLVAPQALTPIKGLPAGSATRTWGHASVSAHVFGKPIELIKGEGSFSAPHMAAVSANAQLYMLGAAIPGAGYNKSAPVLEYDAVPFSLPLTKAEASFTFTVGPIPVTVAVGAKGSVGVQVNLRVAQMWANGRVIPFIKADAYADAYLNLFIAKAGADAQLKLVDAALDVYGFAGVAYIPVAAGQPPQFAYSYQLSLLDNISALSGSVNAYVAVRVPKFIGWRWKRFNYELFRWDDGFSANGYLVNLIKGPLPVATLAE